MKTSKPLQEILLRIILAYATETPLFIKIINLLFVSYLLDNVLIYPIKLILSLEILITCIKFLMQETNNLSIEIKKFILIWRDNEFLKTELKNRNSVKSQLISHYFGEFTEVNQCDRGGENLIKLENSLIKETEIKEIFQKRNGNYQINGEEISKKSLQARLNGLKSRVKNSSNYQELNKKINFTEKCLQEIEEMESIKKEGLILE
jgi:hypothetical protein